MVRVRYVGILFPETQFAKFHGAYRELCAMRVNCKPMSEDYAAVCDLIGAFDKCAAHFTGKAHFFLGSPAPVDPRSTP